MKKPVVAFVLGPLVGMSALAQEAAAPAPPLTGNIAATSNYKFRGQDQGNRAAFFKPAIQGGFDYSNSGFYIGNWNSSIGWVRNGNVEIDLYGGYKGEIAPDFGYDVGVLTYVYPGSGYANTTEIYGALAYSIASLKYSHTVTDKYFGFTKARNTGYLDFSANYAIVPNLTLNAHVGYTRFDGSTNDGDGNRPDRYVDYKAGVTYDTGFYGLMVAGAAVGANKKDYWGDINKTRFVLTVSKTL